MASHLVGRLAPPRSANCQFAASFFKVLQLTGILEAWPPILWVVSLLPRSANCQFAASSFKVLRLAGILQAGLGARWFEDLPSLLLSFTPSLLLSFSPSIFSQCRQNTAVAFQFPATPFQFPARPLHVPALQFQFRSPHVHFTARSNLFTTRPIFSLPGH